MGRRVLVVVKNLARDAIVSESDDICGNILRQLSTDAQPRMIAKVIHHLTLEN